MSNQNPLIVPMTVEALVVNDVFRTNGNTFVRNQMLYGAMSSCNNGQPLLSNNDTNFTLHSTVPVPPSQTPAGQYYNGVYLKWRLPESFTSGVQNNVTGITEYPLVPNRWLIVRYSGPLTQRVATAWIVESDHTFPNNVFPQPTNASMVPTAYVKANANGMPTQQYIGQNFPLASGSWTESGNDLQLTAMAPGNPAFGVFQPQNNNVFSFIDCLNGSSPETLSYMVSGWFSNPESDPLYASLAQWTISTGNNVTSTLIFSASSSSQINWTAGTLTISGTVYNIAAGNTGSMSEQTYLYFDPMVSNTALQSTTVLATAQAGIPIVTATPFFVAQLSALGWTLPSGTDPTLSASWSLIYGSVSGVQWQNSVLPPGGVPTPGDGAPPVSVAVGNSSIEALTAMITAQAAQQGVPVDAELLEAFQLDLTEVFDMPDGAVVLAEKLQASFFQKFSGGYTWNIVDAPESTTQISQDELTKELAWLATLNQNQAKLDEALSELASLQSQLYKMWWKYADWPNAIQEECGVPGLETQKKLAQQLDPTFKGGLAQLTNAQMATVAALTALVPTGDTQADLAQSILAYATQQSLPATRLLKRLVAPLFYKPNNPVVLIAGAGASGIVQSSDTTLCRFPSQLVTGFNYNSTPITAGTSGLSIPQPNLTSVSGAPWSVAFINSLVQEFFFLDTNNATVIATAISASVNDVQTAMSDQANDIGSYPTGAVEQWTANPWHPLLMFWQLNYYPIEFGPPSAPNWNFDDGQFFWNGSQSSVVTSNTYIYNSMIQLTPMANFNMQSRINAFLASNPSLDPLEKQEFETLLNFVQTSDSWDLLSQAMDGFNEQMQLGMPGVFIGPASYPTASTPSLASLIGTATGYPTMLGNIPESKPYPPTGFLPLRAGQFEFIQLVLIDEWGQALWPINSNNYTKATIYTPPEMTPIQSSEPVTFTVSSTPAISSISPTLALTSDSAVTLTVNGVNFVNGATIQWGGTALTTTFVSSTQLTASLGSSQLQSQGPVNVSVSSGGTTSNLISFNVASGATIGSISPNLLQAGMVPSSTFTLIVSGVGFVLGSSVEWNGVAVPTEFVSSTTLIATVSANYAFAPGTANVTVSSGGTTSNTSVFTLSAGAAIVSLEPAIAAAGASGFTLTVNGVGFEPTTTVLWNNAALATTFVSASELSAAVNSTMLSQGGSIEVTASIGACVLPNVANSLIQLPPALLQASQLNFDLISAASDSVVFGPANPTADPICGWVLPNHLDHSLMAYDPSGISLGEMSLGITGSDALAVSWMPSPGSPYATLAEIATSIPHFGNFLLTLSQQPTATFSAFLAAIDDTLWTTAPMGTSFDQNLAMLMGRPLAMVRANLQFLLDGAANADPSWQYTFSPATNQLATYSFPVELGNIAQLEDGLIGYFVGDSYGTFNVVTESGAAESSYLKPIGVDDNYIYLPFDGTTSTFISMLVDPYAEVHATTGILPVNAVSLPPEFTASAIAAMGVTFRLDGILTDQQISANGDVTVLVPVPNEKSGVWTWVENEEGTWTTYPTGPNNTTARLTNVAPVLRRGFLQLNSGLSS